jgi:hypothetical protein
MKLPGVSGVYDYAGPDRNSRYRPRPCCLPPMQKRQRPDCIFSKLNTQPTCTPVYASPHTSRCATQNSGPSGSLLLSRRTVSVPASCRFIPAHCIGDLATTEIRRAAIASTSAFFTVLIGRHTTFQARSCCGNRAAAVRPGLALQGTSCSTISVQARRKVSGWYTQSRWPRSRPEALEESPELRSAYRLRPTQCRCRSKDSA